MFCYVYGRVETLINTEKYCTERDRERYYKRDRERQRDGDEVGFCTVYVLYMCGKPNNGNTYDCLYVTLNGNGFS